MLGSSFGVRTLASLSTVRGEIALSVVMLVALEVREVWLLRVELDEDLGTSASELSVSDVDGLLELDLRRCSSCSRMRDRRLPISMGLGVSVNWMTSRSDRGEMAFGLRGWIFREPLVWDRRRDGRR